MDVVGIGVVVLPSIGFAVGVVVVLVVAVVDGLLPSVVAALLLVVGVLAEELFPCTFWMGVNSTSISIGVKIICV